jgi:hypothetical protein
LRDSAAKSIYFERNQSGVCLLNKCGEVFVRRTGLILAMITTVFHCPHFDD